MKDIKTATIREVAAYVGVNQGTVSRALSPNFSHLVAPETLRKVRQAAKELGYQPNINAKRMFLKRSFILGFVLPTAGDGREGIFDNAHVLSILYGIERALAKTDFKVMLLVADSDFIRRKDFLNLFTTKQVDGLFIWGAFDGDDFWSELNEYRDSYPHLFITTHPACVKNTPNFISNDIEEAAYITCAHLFAKGFNNVVWYATPEYNSAFASQKKGIDRACAEYGRTLAATYMQPYSAEAAAAFMRAHTGDIQKWNAMIFTSQEAASGALDYCRSHNISVPGDIAIAACDNNQRVSKIEITSASGNDVLLGENAAKALLSQILPKDKVGEVCYRIPVQLLEGLTT